MLALLQLEQLQQLLIAALMMTDPTAVSSHLSLTAVSGRAKNGV